MAKELEPHIPGIEYFGMVKDPHTDNWRPFLQKQATEEDACTDCRGYGFGGMPLCGAVYMCKSCNGTGYRQPGQPPYVPEEKRKEDKCQKCDGNKKKQLVTKSWWRRLLNWRKNG
jgi:hypothetical protein